MKNLIVGSVSVFVLFLFIGCTQGQNLGQGCTDGTAVNACSVVKPMKCVNQTQGNATVFTLVPDCAVCGCSQNQTCANATKLCVNASIDSGSSGQDNQPTGCSITGCQSGYFCHTQTGECKPIPKCIDGTYEGSCSSTIKPLTCAAGQLKTDCTKCGCPGSGICVESTGQCSNVQQCENGTNHAQCSTTKPKYCNNGQLTDFCVLCGCPAGHTCNSGNQTCEAVKKCSDNTTLSTCSATPPKYCNELGQLVDDCTKCTCGSPTLECKNNACTAKAQVCRDGTSYNACSTSKPKHCNSYGVLVDNCAVCSCPGNQTCSSSTRTCG